MKRAIGLCARLAEPLAGRLLRLGLIRRALHRRALRAWRATDTPLILCFGNINRSPFAAALARARPGSRASSAGFYPETGRPSPGRTVAVAKRYGVDLSEHRSAVVSSAQLSDAKAIFVFDLENLVRLAARDPRALRRAHLLGTLGKSGAAVIVDPHGRADAVLAQVLGEIAGSIDWADHASA